MQQHLSKTLINLQYAMEEAPIPTPPPMAGDQWVLASALQKSIRRGDVDCALRSAYSLWNIDRQSFWRRLHVASLEDVGVINPGLIVDTLTATASSMWRKKCGDLRVGLHLAKQLCLSPKTRIADEILIQAERAPCHAVLREQYAYADDESLADAIAGGGRPLLERCLAAWYLAGTKKFPSDLMPKRRGQPEDAAEVLRTLDAPMDLIESCIAVIGRTQWPLALFTPIIFEEAKKHTKEAVIRHEELAASPEVNGVPVWACDMFTRIGQSSFRKLQKEVPQLKTFTTRQIGLGVFYKEGGLLDKTLTSAFFDEIRLAGELADMECAGLSIPEYMALSETLASTSQLLDDIRVQQLTRYFDGAESCAA